MKCRVANLTELLLRPEGKTLELERDLSSPAGTLRTVVAFANTSDGIVLVGADDGTHAVRGVSEPLALEERVASLVSDSILPRVLPDIELLAFRNTHVLAIRIRPCAARPHYLVRSGPEEGGLRPGRFDEPPRRPGDAGRNAPLVQAGPGRCWRDQRQHQGRA